VGKITKEGGEGKPRRAQNQKATTKGTWEMWGFNIATKVNRSPNNGHWLAEKRGKVRNEKGGSRVKYGGGGSQYGKKS